MGVAGYVVALLVFNFIVLLFIYAVLRLQGHLPLNPAHVPGMNPWVAFNTAVELRHQHELAGLRAGDAR